MINGFTPAKRQRRLGADKRDCKLARHDGHPSGREKSGLILYKGWADGRPSPVVAGVEGIKVFLLDFGQKCRKVQFFC